MDIKIISFPGSNDFLGQTFDTSRTEAKQFSELFSATINVIELSVQIFSVGVIRFYEDKLATDDVAYKKKAQPILKIISERFLAPSLGTNLELARGCFHMVDNTAPIELLEMKTKLEETITLGALGFYLDDLTHLYESLEDETELKPIIQNRDKSKKKFLAILNDFVPFRNDSAHLVNISKLIDDNHIRLNLNYENWKKGFEFLLEHLIPFLTLKYKLKTIGSILTENNIKMVSVNTWEFNGNKISTKQDKLKLEDWYDDQWEEQPSITLTRQDGSKRDVEIFPFLRIKDGKLYNYKKTTGSGYLYFCISDDKTLKQVSKKKFVRTLFKTSKATNAQTIFWSEVVPQINPQNSIKANIPSQGGPKFIGRKKKIATIRQEIIEIPNQNGIIYGPGGVGKTALLIELTHLLYSEPNAADVLYPNIIWISAKSNFYYWEQDATIDKPQQFESLENILQIILRFFDYEDVNEYSNEELKDLVFDLLDENKILLVLDNFETIAKNEISRIITFFEKDVKRHLRFKPTYFKVLITSRQQIPSGYYQIKLEGLDLKDSKQLMANIYENYKDGQQPLTNDQCNLIHEAAQGIPIVIKHCLGQIYEFSRPLADVISNLSNEQSEVIKFSYSELIAHLKKGKEFLQILLFLEIKNGPSSIRQIALTLELETLEISTRIPLLLSFQCIDQINIGIEQKYKISNQIGLLAKKLIGENPELTTSIRKKITANLTWEKRIDSEIEEWEIIEVFNSRIEARDYEYAEVFLNSEIQKRPGSLLLNLHKAIFLRDRRNNVNEAISILESINSEIGASGRKNLSIIVTLAQTYMKKEFPDFERGNECCKEILELADQEETIFFVGEFYIVWSSYMKNRKELDPFKEMERRTKVKKLAKQGITILTPLSTQFGNHRYHFLIAQAYFNQWDTINAKRFINRAIELAQTDPSALRKYEIFLASILKYI